MIKFYDPSGASHFGQASITRTTSVNGGLSLTGEVFDGDDVLNGLDYGWWLNFDNEKYVITYKKLSDDTNTIVFDAVQQFFWDFAKVALHSQYTGSHEYAFYLNQLFNGSGYTYKNDVTVPAFEKENWGYKNKLSLFNDIIDQADVEFEVHNETVHIANQIGSDLTSFVRKGINLSDLTEEIKISDFATYAKGYGAFEDPQDPSKGRLEVEYRSELADKFGVLEMDPIVDERYTIANNLIAELKKKIDATYTVSMTMNIYDLESAGYLNYESPKVGDWILAIDEALNFKRKIRIIKLEEKFDVTGKRIGYTATCGDLSIVDQYTNLQGSLDSKVQRIQESIDSVAASANGKNSNYYGAKEPVNANEGDLWFDQSNSDPDKWTIKQWLNGRWEQITLNPGEISDKVAAVRAEAESAVEKAEQLATKYDDTNSLASQAFDRATSAQNAASSAVATAHSTASEFGNVSQKADSAVASALNAQSAASDAVKQASSAAADSKDAKQIAGAVSQSYKTLTDGSTMTIAELESGLAVKLTKTDLDGYATETWAQNQINATADGINATLSSVKSTVDGQTTSINDLKADSSSFKSQFTTVNDTLGKQTTDIGSLQASSKELTSGFNTLTSDNTTNKNDISQLKQTSTELSSTMTTVQTQVQNSAVGTNLYTGTKNFDNIESWFGNDSWTKITDNYNELSVIQTTGDWDGLSQYIQVKKGDVLTYSVYAKYVSGTGTSSIYWALNGQTEGSYNTATTNPINNAVTITDSWQRVSGTAVATSDGYLRPRIERTNSNTNTLQIAGIKVEKGSLTTDWCPNPADNTTVTAFSKLSQTVDGMKSDISKKIEQKDLNGYATETWTQNKINTTADGINGTLSNVKTTVDGHDTSINELKVDSSSFKAQFTTVNGTLDKQSTDIGTLQASSKSLSASFDSLSSDNQTNQHNISQLQSSAETFNSTLMTVQQRVTDSAVGTNLLLKTGTPFSITGNNTFNQGKYGYSLTNGYNVSSLASALGTQFTLSFDWSVSGDSPSGTFMAQYNNTPWTQTSPVTVSSSNTSGHVSNPFNASADSANVANMIGLRLDNFVGTITIYNVKLEKGGTETDYSANPADNATVDAVSSISQTIEHIQTTVSSKVDGETYRSDISQLNDQINLRVESKGVINAVNVSKEGIQIYGDKLHITATTFIDDAIIKDAMIESINADKIKVGTIDADKIQVIHLNADNITAGTIRGGNLSINLNTGNVEFQKGRVHSADNSIDININNKYISVANDVNRVMLKNGELQFVEPSILDTEDSPYLRIHNRGGAIYGGTEIIARDYISLSNAANSNDFFADDMGLQKFSGLFTGYDRISKKWRPTVVGGAERGVIITGGSLANTKPIESSPRIVVGYDNGTNFTGGNRILLDAAFVHSFATYTKTSSQSPNVYVSTDGALLRSTSASKYKTNIVRGYSTEYGNKLINLPTATWIDKASLKRYNEDPSQPVPSLNYGMIAEDLADAGLENLVVRNDEGGLEGIQYDRIVVALLPLLAEWKQIIDNQEKEINELKNKKEQ